MGEGLCHIDEIKFLLWLSAEQPFAVHSNGWTDQDLHIKPNTGFEPQKTSKFYKGSKDCNLCKARESVMTLSVTILKNGKICISKRNSCNNIKHCIKHTKNPDG